MKKGLKKYFIISGIIQMIMGTLLIIFAKELGEYVITFLRLIVSWSDKTISIIVGTLYLLTNVEIFITLFAKSKKGNDPKRTLLDYIAISMLALSPVNIILSLTSIILILKNNKKNIKEKKQIKKLPKVRNIPISNKKLIIGVVLLLSYMFMNFWWPEIPIIFSSIIDQIILDVIYLIICIWIFYKPILTNIKEYFNNYKIYTKFILKSLFVYMAIYIPFSALTMYLVGGVDSVNQAGLREYPLLYVVPLAIIWAPIVEEILFRGIIRNIFKNKWLFVIISSISFGLLHTNFETTLSLVFIQAIPYVIMGGLMSYVYAKSDNILTSVSCHMVINTIASLAIIFL